MNREEVARQLKKDGKNCSVAIYSVFKDDYKLSGEVPEPRSIDGKCGALLMTKQILKDLGKDQHIDEYEKIFKEKFGYLTCLELMRHERRCNDYVGESVKLLEKYLNEEML